MLTETDRAAEEASCGTASHWTWADQLSTYRFWGLAALYFLSLAGYELTSTFLTKTIAIAAQYSAFHMLSFIGGAVLAIYPAWIASRYNAKAVLFIESALQLIGTILVMAAVSSKAGPMLIAGGFLAGLGAAAIGLSVPIILARGRSDAVTFAVAFGALFVFSRLGDVLYSAVLGLIYNRQAAGAVVVAFAVLPLLFLIPVKASMFKTPPPPRGRSIPPQRRGPVSAAFACLVPFFHLYWIYRIHGEVACVAPSRSILSPGAAVLIGIFVPFLVPMCLASLSDALNHRASEQGKPPHRNTLAVFLWSLFCVPVALALLQSGLNRAV